MSIRELSEEPRTPRPTRSEVRRRLVDAAADVFAAKGYAASSVDDIARQAGLTKGAVYSNFKSKDDLFFELLGEQVTARIDLVDSLPDSPEPAETWLRNVGDTLTAAMVNDPGWHVLFIEFWQRSIRDDAARERFVPRRRELHDLIARTIDRRADELGLTPPLPSGQLATAILAFSNGLAIEYMLDPDSVAPDLFGNVLAKLVADPDG